MAITVKKTLLNNQSVLQNFALGEELDEQAAEIISGGKSLSATLSNREIYALNEGEPEDIESSQLSNLTFGVI